MTDKEKVEAYDKALHYAKIYYSQGDENMKLMMSTCFPELVESEDEKVRKEIAFTLEYLVSTPKSALHPGAHYTVEEALAWLEKQGERKPAEWSEEDEDYINDLIKYFSQNERLKNTKEDIVIWLKSLRPQNTWKPSDEQIKAIRLARAFVTDDFSENPTLSDVLVELEEQLKKLKEE
jgi:hypothetical protein